MTGAESKPYGDPNRAKVMLVGHDPRLQASETVAPYCLFADYYFRPRPQSGAGARKYGLAAAAFGLVTDLTGGAVPPGEVLLTNLCNRALPHAPKGKTVLIPEHEAECGVRRLRWLLDGSTVRVILAMSQQVNYWLQRLRFCSQCEEFLVAAEPVEAGLRNKPPFYQPEARRAFTLVCGKRHDGPCGIPVFPVVHVKNWPLKGGFKDAYGGAHAECTLAIRKLLATREQ